MLELIVGLQFVLCIVLFLDGIRLRRLEKKVAKLEEQ